MNQPVLYLMVGYPGSGKTTAAHIIHELTGAVHLWADKIRRERSNEPTYSHEENLELYQHLNELTSELLRAGNSVIFDTNFNFYKDREHLRHIAAKHGAKAVVVWVQTPVAVARERATNAQQRNHTRVLGDELGNMPLSKFNRMAHNLQEPRESEQPIALDGTRITAEYVRQTLATADVLS